MNNFKFCEGIGCPVKKQCIKYTTQPIGSSKQDKYPVFSETPGRYFETKYSKKWMCKERINNF